MSVDARVRSAHPIRQASNRSEYESSSSVYSDAGSVNSHPHVERPSTDNLLEYYHSEDAGRTYIQPVGALNVRRAFAIEGISSSSSSLLNTPSIGRKSREPSPARSHTSQSKLPLSDATPPSKRVSEASTVVPDRRRYVTSEADPAPKSTDRVKDLRPPRVVPGPEVRREQDGAKSSPSKDPVPLDVSSHRRSEPAKPSSLSVSKHAGDEQNSHGSYTRPISDSQSTDLTHKKQRSASRDIGIVGTSPSSPSFNIHRGHTREKTVTVKELPYNKDGSLQSAPIFQRGPGPEPPPELSSSKSSSSRPLQSAPAYQMSFLPSDSSDSEPTKPRDPRRPVSGSESTATATATQNHPQDWNASMSPYVQPIEISDPEYLNYVAGIHASAGPLPSPPRTIIPPASGAAPPRPPRMQSPPPGGRRKRAESPATQSLTGSLLSAISTPPASRDGSRPHSKTGSPLKVPRSIANSTATTPESISIPLPVTTDSADEKTPRRTKHHIREGASSERSEPPPFDKPSREVREVKPPKAAKSDAAIVVTTLGDSSDESSKRTTDNESRASTSKRDEHVKAPVISRQPSWISEQSKAPSTRIHKREATETGANVETASMRSYQSSLSSRPHEVRRTPSSLSVSRNSARSSIMSPSTLHAAAEKVVRPRRPVSASPPAMQFTDVLALRTSLERTAAYARKLKELSQCQCGLDDWLEAERDKKLQRHASQISVDLPMSPSSTSFLGVPRKVSHGSVASEATFPVRADAYIATDLTSKTNDDVESVSGHSMNMPYPSLVRVTSRTQNYLTQSNNTSSSSLSVSSPMTMTAMTGFLASIGRKASMRSPKSSVQPSTSPTATSKLISSRLPISPPQPKAILGPTHIPGGPRSPIRVNRTPSLMPQKRTPMATIPQEETLSLARSPSLPAASRLTSPTLDEASFNRQMDKLADILPHVDRSILAGYLRRAGQDILAIGQYLEDEKNDRVRYDA